MTPQSRTQRVEPAVSALFLPVLLISLSFTFLSFVLPVYGKGVGASALAIGGLYSAFTVATLIGRPVVGWALDRFGRKTFLVFAFASYAAALLLFALARDLPGLYAARLAQGIASSLLWITLRTVVADVSPPETVGQAMGRIDEQQARGEMAGAFAGFALFRALGQDSGWQAAFLVFAAGGALATALVWRRASETRPAALSAATVKAAPSPLVVSRALIVLMAIVFTTGASLELAGPMYLVYLLDRFQIEPGLLALAFLPGGVLYAVLPSRTGRWSDRWGRAPLIALGLVTSGVLSMLLPFLPRLEWLIVLYTLTSIGWSFAGPAEAAMVNDLADAGSRGRGYGLYEFARSLGGAAGPLAGGWLYDNAGRESPFVLSGVVLLACALWIIAAFGRRGTLFRHE